jgi:preprotein translocase subunit YajC
MSLPFFFLAADAVSAFSSTLMPIVMVGAVFVFLVYLPNRKEEAARKELIAGLQRGDKVVTDAGIHGKMHEARGETLVLEISPGSFLTVDREKIRAKVVEKAVEAAKKS